MTQASGSEVEDQLREARAWNRSIYLMICMPYLIIGTFGYVIYRGLRQKALADEQRARELQAAGCEDSPQGTIAS